MIPLLKAFFRTFLWDEQAARRYLLGALGFLISVAGSLAVYGADALSTWTWVDWKKHVVVAAIGAVLAMLPAPLGVRPAVERPPQGYAGLGALALLTLLAVTSCTVFKAVGQATTRCGQKVLTEIEQAQLVQLQPAVDAALRQDWSKALGLLVELAAKYGYDLVDCVVSDLANFYNAALMGNVQPAPPERLSLGEVADSSAELARAHDNARGWLARRR